MVDAPLARVVTGQLIGSAPVPVTRPLSASPEIDTGPAFVTANVRSTGCPIAVTVAGRAEDDTCRAPMPVLVNVQVMFCALPLPPAASLDCGIETLWIIELPLGSRLPSPSTQATPVL